MKTGAALALLLSAAALAAQHGPQPALAPAGERIESEVRADFDGDGAPDVASVVRGEDEARELRVLLSSPGTGANGEHLPEVLKLASYPLIDAALKVTGNVLLLVELTGGTTAVASTHRFRWDSGIGAMRLIGLDALLYSRTFAHDGRAASWNLLTGDLLTHTMRLRHDDSDIAYDEVDKRRKRKKSKPLRLDQAPSGDILIGWPGGS